MKKFLFFSLIIAVLSACKKNYNTPDSNSNYVDFRNRYISYEYKNAPYGTPLNLPEETLLDSIINKKLGIPSYPFIPVSYETNVFTYLLVYPFEQDIFLQTPRTDKSGNPIVLGPGVDPDSLSYTYYADSRNLFPVNYFLIESYRFLKDDYVELYEYGGKQLKRIFEIEGKYDLFVTEKWEKWSTHDVIYTKQGHINKNFKIQTYLK